MKYIGRVRKLKTNLLNNGLSDAEPNIQYHLPLASLDSETGKEIDTQLVSLNELIGRTIKIENQAEIHCISCGRKTKKSFAQGYCYPCFSSLPECDSCIMSPEKCHYQEGTCRDSSWGEEFCMQDHYVYLARSSSVKVGITRGTQIPTRWMDQGAIEALPIAKVSQRLYSGLLEVIFKQHVSDRTSWQKMLKGEVADVDLKAKRDELFDLCKEELVKVSDELNTLSSDSGSAIELLHDEEIVLINYPVETYPTKVKSFNLDKIPEAEGKLMGVKGQYLILDTGVINIRKYTGYQLKFTFTD